MVPGAEVLDWVPGPIAKVHANECNVFVAYPLIAIASRTGAGRNVNGNTTGGAIEPELLLYAWD